MLDETSHFVATLAMTGPALAVLTQVARGWLDIWVPERAAYRAALYRTLKLTLCVGVAVAVRLGDTGSGQVPWLAVAAGALTAFGTGTGTYHVLGAHQTRTRVDTAPRAQSGSPTPLQT